MTVRIVTDSVASLPADLLDEFGIVSAPLFVVHDGVATPDPEIEEAAFYKELESLETLPTTSQASMEELTRLFTEAVSAGHDVVGIFISEGMSGTAQAARVAAEVVLADAPGRRIEVVDSRSNSMQEGFAVLSAAQVARDGGSVEECIEAARQTILRTRYLFTPHTLEYLRRGGRIGTASAFLGQLLQISPILTVEHGQTEAFARVRTTKKALATIADQLKADAAEKGLKRVVVHYISDKPTADRFAKEQIEPIAGQPVRVLPVSPVIGVHVGPAVAIAYETEEPLRDSV